MATEEMEIDRKKNVVASPASTGDVLACNVCDQEMGTVDGIVPLHMKLGKLCQGSYSEGSKPKASSKIIQPPLTIPDVSGLSVSEILCSDTCLSCGNVKAPGQTVCRTCHGMLPFLHQKSLPPWLRGYLFTDEQRIIAGHYTKAQFMEVFKQALETLVDMRAQLGK
jgi:hypothetical protein